jgi:hypothetical protein
MSLTGLPVPALSPLGLKATVKTEPEGAAMTGPGSRQIRAMPSSSPVASVPSAPQATASTGAGCGSVALRVPLGRVHRYALLSALPAAIIFPPGLKASE